MGKITGFMELRGAGARCSPPPSASSNYREFVLALTDDEASKQGARCMDCGIPFCQTRLPGQQRHPGLERPRLPRQLARGARRAALDQQLPGVHRPRLPGALRGGVHAEHQRRRGRPSSRSSRPSSTRAGRRAGSSRSRRRDRTGRRVAVVGSGPAGLACAQQLARAGHDVDGLREGRPHRRAAALRHPRLQDGEAPDRPAHGADVDRGRRVPPRRQRRRRPSRGASCSPTSTPSCSPAAPSSRATCRCPAASSPASTSRWSSCRSRTRSSPATTCRARSPRRASTSS